MAEAWGLAQIAVGAGFPGFGRNGYRAAFAGIDCRRWNSADAIAFPSGEAAEPGGGHKGIDNQRGNSADAIAFPSGEGAPRRGADEVYAQDCTARVYELGKTRFEARYRPQRKRKPHPALRATFPRGEGYGARL